MSDAILDDLRGQLADGDVVAVVGAGLSLLATNGAAVASWTGLLKNGVERCREIAEVDDAWVQRAMADIDSGDMDGLLASAEKITSKLGGSGGPEFRLWLEATVGSLQPTSPAALKALENLGVPILTTNYDGLLEEVTGRDAVTWKDTVRVQRVLRGKDNAIVHLHGHWTKPESIVLGIRSYDTIIGSNIQAMLHALAGMKCMLLIGFGAGLQDPNFGALRQWMATTYAQSPFRHFRLHGQQEYELVRNVHTPGERVFLISYGLGFDDLATFLRQLGNTTRAAALVPSPPLDDRQPQQRAWHQDVTDRASAIAQAQMTVLETIKDKIPSEVYDAKQSEIVERALALVREQLEGRLLTP